jgi:short-subunit dehydrogenase
VFDDVPAGAVRDFVLNVSGFASGTKADKEPLRGVAMPPLEDFDRERVKVDESKRTKIPFPEAQNSRTPGAVCPVTTSFFRDRSVLVTGASSGIGEELAWQLAQAGAKLTLAARRTELLDALAQRIVSSGKAAPAVAACDVSKDGDMERTVAAAVGRWSKLDVVVANAGFGVVGTFASLTLDDYRRQFETNVFGVLRTIYAALPEIEKSRGNVVIIGSVAGWVASPGASAYAMSKFAVRALANAIAPELRLAGVTVTLISPGFVTSNIRRVDNQGRLHAEAADPVPRALVVSTDKAVREMVRAIAGGKREAIITGHGKALVAAARFLPWVLRVAERRIAARGGYRSEPSAEGQ